jgi:hypothetical protein
VRACARVVAGFAAGCGDEGGVDYEWAIALVRSLWPLFTKKRAALKLQRVFGTKDSLVGFKTPV